MKESADLYTATFSPLLKGEGQGEGSLTAARLANSRVPE